MSRRKYTYQVVSAAAVFGKPHASIRAASVAAARIRDNGTFRGWDFELRRIYELENAGRLYWHMRGKRWVPWTSSASVADRKPARFWPAQKGGG